MQEVYLIITSYCGNIKQAQIEMKCNSEGTRGAAVSNPEWCRLPCTIWNTVSLDILMDYYFYKLYRTAAYNKYLQYVLYYSRESVKPLDSFVDAHMCWSQQWTPPIPSHSLPQAALHGDWPMVTSSHIAQKQAPRKVWLHCLYPVRWWGSSRRTSSPADFHKRSLASLHEGLAHLQSKTRGGGGGTFTS